MNKPPNKIWNLVILAMALCVLTVAKSAVSEESVNAAVEEIDNVELYLESITQWYDDFNASVEPACNCKCNCSTNPPPTESAVIIVIIVLSVAGGLFGVFWVVLHCKKPINYCCATRTQGGAVVAVGPADGNAIPPVAADVIANPTSSC